MTNPYTQVTVTGYNASPPADDGTEVASNQVNWSKHKTKLTDPLKTALESIDTNVFAAFAEIVATPNVPRGYIDGLILSNDTDTEHDISMAAGTCKSAGNTATITNSSAIVKRIDASWAEGTTNGGFPSGISLAADTWYSFFAIAKADGTVDAGFDTSLTAANLLADATEYTEYRRIGFLLTNSSSNIIGFEQESDHFYWNSPFADETNTGGIGTTENLVVLSVPPNLRVRALFSARLLDASVVGDTYVLVRPTRTDDTAPTSGLFNMTVGSAALMTQQFDMHVDSSGRIAYRASQSTVDHEFHIATHGWVDPRGKNG